MTLPVVTVTDTQIVFPLTDLMPAGVLRAGVQPVQIVQPLMMGRPRVAHTGVESNVMPVVIRPTVSNLKVITPLALTLDVDLTVGQSQRVLLLLNKTTGNEGTSFAIEAKPRSADLNTLKIPMDGIQAGEYWVRLQIDGAESLLEFSSDVANPTITGPKVLVPPAVKRLTVINQPPDPKQLKVELDVTVGRAQAVKLTLTPDGGANPPVEINALPRSTDAQTLTLPIAGVPAGDYQARISIDGVTSLADTPVTIP
jgi:hypothetical protein